MTPNTCSGKEAPGKQGVYFVLVLDIIHTDFLLPCEQNYTTVPVLVPGKKYKYPRIEGIIYLTAQLTDMHGVVAIYSLNPCVRVPALDQYKLPAPQFIPTAPTPHQQPQPRNTVILEAPALLACFYRTVPYGDYLSRQLLSHEEGPEQ